MKLKALLTYSVVIFSCFVHAQDQDKLIELDVRGVGKFKYPPNALEIQNRSLKAINDSIRSSYVIDVPTSKLTLQQTGLNEGENYKYARVVFEKYAGQPGDYLSSDQMVNTLTEEQSLQIKEYYKASVVNGYEAMGVNIVKWYPVELLEINGQFTIYLHFVRQSTVGKGNVDLNLYCFPDGDKEIDITLSSREVNASNWKTVFSGIVNSFRLN